VVWQAKVQDAEGLVILLMSVLALPATRLLQSEACNVHTVEGQALHSNRQSTAFESLLLKA